MFDFINITKGLADENRVRILLALNGREELCVCQLMDMLQLAPSTVSKNLFILRNARLVPGRNEGRWIHYRLDTEGAPAEAVGALEWGIRSMAADPMIRKDAVRLREQLSDKTTAKCSP